MKARLFMLIYHYAAQPFDVLKTLEAQGKTNNIPSIPDYNQHISFFLEPIPFDFMGTVFGPKHHTWFPGSTVYEHTVLVKDITGFRYRIVESPEKTLLYYDDTISDNEYHALLAKLIKENHYEGRDPQVFEKIQRKLKGTVREGYAKLSTRPNFAEIRDKYAATVPHVMLYPDKGVTPVKSHRQLKIGQGPIPKLGVVPKPVGFSTWK